MRDAEAALAQIARRARFLHEVVAAAPRATGGKLDDLGRCRLKRWQEALRGGREALDARIASTGWPRGAIETALCDIPDTFAGGPDPDTVPWLRLLAQVVAAEDWDPRLPGLDRLPFGELLCGFLAAARATLCDRLGGGVPRRVSAGAMEDCEMVLAERLSRLLAPCLLAEFDRERPAGPAILGLMLDAPEQEFGHTRYEAFVARQRDERLVGVLTGYPVAARLAAVHVLDWVDWTQEMFERLAHDLPEIGKVLIGRRGWQADLVSVAGGLSDPHDGGRTVCILGFADGAKVVYKPRSLAPEATWRRLVAMFDPAFQALAPRSIDGGQYGWMAHVAPAADVAHEAIPGFYRSAGHLLALAWAFAVTDLHFENVIAAGGQLVPVDLETLAQPRATTAAPSSTTPGDEVGRQFLDSSVLSTRAVPEPTTLGGGETADISALADLRGRTVRRRAWTALGSDAMFFTPSDQPVPHQHMPRTDGAAVPVSRHLPDLLAGFEHGWQVLASARARLLSADGPLRDGDWPVRYIHRPTDVYARLLARATEPSILRSGIDYSIEIEALYARVFAGSGNADELATIDAESRALHRGDVPRFLTSAGTGPAAASRDRSVDGFLAASGLEVIRERLASLTPARLKDESQLIRAGIHAMARDAPEARPPLPSCSTPSFTPDEALAAAVELGRSLLDTAISRPDGGTRWVGISHREEANGQAPGLLDESLYEGSTGTALFLSALGRITGDAVWGDAARAALRDTRAVARFLDAGRTEAVGRSAGLGGLGGLAYGLALAGTLLADDAIARDAAALAARIDLAPTDRASDQDVIAGRVGAIPALLAGSRSRGTTGGLPRATICALGRDIVAGSAPPPPGAGYGHGRPGALATLAHLADVDPGLRRILVATRKTCPPVAASGHAGWCKGRIGSALGRFVLSQRLGCPLDTDADAVEAAAAAAASRADTLDQVCCGLFGGVEALLVVAATGRDDAERQALDLAARVLARAKAQSGFRLLAGVPPGFPNPGFFQGVSGIGYVLLRAARPNVLPSALIGELPI